MQHDPHRSHPSASRAALALMLLAGCSRSIGDDSVGGEGGSGEGGSFDGESPNGVSADGGSGADGPDAPLWTHVLESNTMVYRITAMPDGGVASIEIEFDTWEYWAARRAPDGSLLWRIELQDAWLDSIARLPDGRLFVGGVLHDAEGEHALVWRLSESGAIEASHTYALSGLGVDPTVIDIEVAGDGVAYVVDNGAPGRGDATLWWANLDLEPQWSWTGYPSYVRDLAVLPTGEVLTLEPLSFEEGTDIMRSFTADGAPAGEQVVPRSTFAADEPLVQVELAEDDRVRLHGLGDTAALDVVLMEGPLAGPPWVTYDQGNVAVARPISSEHRLSLLQLDADGNELRTLVRSPLVMELVWVSDVAIAPDGSVYLSGTERHETDETGFPPLEHGFLLKLPPP
jgi:hypothetical protein